GYIIPLWIYVNDIGGSAKKKPNLDQKIYSKIQSLIPDVSPESLFYYIYATLFSPTYRKRYIEFLKSDFPRIPYPQDKKTFHALAKLGAKLRELHLMESKTLDKLITKYPIPGSHKVETPRFGKDRVWINETQYFDGVPEAAWNFYIGGYHPAQKWLKDRKGRNLTAEEIKHWQRIIVALAETDKIMKEIDEIDFLPQAKKAA
ncbi:MAG TPA: type ISP restriction/modification enzyme, partial [Patescibacteria group bacterium]|nr:type ISP restriction/modification enzyme [Patescibacteria group bacterium]